MPGFKTRSFIVVTERSADDPQRFRWVLFASGDLTPHSRSSHSYLTEEAARSEGVALAAVLNEALAGSGERLGSGWAKKPRQRQSKPMP